MSEIDWTFGGTWPYEPRWFDTTDGRMHYVDEGPREGKPIVMVHGNPTWGYLYRRFIRDVVAAGHRAIALDHLGFGRSDKPDDADLYTIDRHIDRAEALLESLDLSDVTPVVQDWGGPIGLGWATRHPERIRSLMILNTFAHRPPEDVPLPLPLKLFRQPAIGEALVKGLNLFTRGGIFLGGVVKRERLSEEVRSAYLAPHPDWSSRTGVLMFPREIPSGPEGRISELMAEVEEGLEAFADRDVKICWAMRDIAFTEEMLERMWLKSFPDAEVRKIDDAGHYLQEDAHEVIIPELLELVGR